MYGNDEGDEPAMGNQSEEVNTVSFKCVCGGGKRGEEEEGPSSGKRSMIIHSF